MMDEYENEIIDIYAPLPSEDNDVGYIHDDLTADWQIDKIKEVQAEMRRKEMVANAKIGQIQEWLKKEREQAEHEINYRKLLLIEYFRELDGQGLVKQTKTQKSYKLPSGTLKLKQQPPEYKRDDEKLLQWVKANKPRFVKIKESPDWAGLKEIVKVAGDKVVDAQTGEIIDGVVVISREPKFEVEVE